jgi:hypothetical protein
MEVVATKSWCYMYVGLWIVTKYSSNDDVTVYVTDDNSQQMEYNISNKDLCVIPITRWHAFLGLQLK